MGCVWPPVREGFQRKVRVGSPSDLNHEEEVLGPPEAVSFVVATQGPEGGPSPGHPTRWARGLHVRPTSWDPRGPLPKGCWGLPCWARGADTAAPVLGRGFMQMRLVTARSSPGEVCRVVPTGSDLALPLL